MGPSAFHYHNYRVVQFLSYPSRSDLFERFNEINKELSEADGYNWGIVLLCLGLPVAVSTEPVPCGAPARSRHAAAALDGWPGDHRSTSLQATNPVCLEVTQPPQHSTKIYVVNLHNISSIVSSITSVILYRVYSRNVCLKLLFIMTNCKESQMGKPLPLVPRKLAP